MKLLRNVCLFCAFCAFARPGFAAGTASPTITITSPTNNQVLNVPVIMVKGTASDNGVVWKVEVKVNAGGWSRATGTTSWTRSLKLAPGSNTITARATNSAGNTQTTFTTVTFTIPLHVIEDQGIARTNEPVSGGIPLPQGLVTNPANIQVWDANNKIVPCQAHQLGISWPDGSLRWAFVQFEAGVGANQTNSHTLHVSPANASVYQSANPFTITQTADAVDVTTGPMKFRVSRTSFKLPNKIWINDGGTFTDADLVINEGARFELVADREYMSPADFNTTKRPASDLATFGLHDSTAGDTAWNKITPNVDYSAYLTGAVNITVEESGPKRTVVRIEKAGEKVEGKVGFIARIYAYAGKKTLRVEFTVENYEQFIPIAANPYYCAISNTKHIRRFRYCLRPTYAIIDDVEMGTDTGILVVAGTADARLSQLAKTAFTVTGGGRQVGTGAKAPGWVKLRRGTKTMTLASKYFWEIYPKAVSFDAAGKEARLELWPDDAPGTGYPLTNGRVKTYEFVLNFDAAPAVARGMARGELRAMVEPAYAAATGSAPRFVALNDPDFSLFNTFFLNTQSGFIGNETPPYGRLFGDIDFGDRTGWSPDQRWNNYHQPSHAWFIYAYASGQPQHFRIAEAMARHVLDVDTQYWGYAVGCREAEYSRRQDHICASPIQGAIKMWVVGEIDYYFMTGSRRALESLKKSANFLMNCSGVVPPSYIPERQSSLPFMFLSSLYEVFGTEAAVKAKYPHAFTPSLFPYRTDADSVLSETMFSRMMGLNTYFSGVFSSNPVPYLKCSFLAGYPVEGFFRFWRLTGDPVALAGVENSANFLYNTIILPTGIVMYAGGAPWSAISPWMPMWNEVDQAAGRAYEATGNPVYLEYGKASTDWNLNYLHCASDGLGGGMSGGLPYYLWALKQGGKTQTDVAVMRPDIAYDKAIATCRAQAEANYHPDGTTDRVYCMLAEEILRCYINLGKFSEALDWHNKWKNQRDAWELYQFLPHIKQ